jgi:Mrp family chromosome partitioning ATPase
MHSDSPSDWPTCDAPFGRLDPPQREASIGKRTLSAFTSQASRPFDGSVPSTAEPASHQESAERFEPVTTIASFAWPTVCRALCQQCGTELDRIADLLIRHAQEGRSLIGVIGMFPKVGATTTTLCIANRIAARGRRTVVVEGNFLAPQLADWLDAKPTAWWQDVLDRSVPAADAVIHAVDDHIDLLPLDATTKYPLRLAGCFQATATADVLRAAYDLVLVDLGPFFDPEAQPITLQLARTMQLDVCLAVAGPKGADPRDVATVAEYLGRRGCHMLGTIENRTANKSATT